MIYAKLTRMNVYNPCVGQDGTIFIYSLSKVNTSEEKDCEADDDELLLSSPVS